MADEIERKFLVPTVPDASALGPGTRLRQGYLAVDGPVEVRVRWKGDRPVLTVKAGAGTTRTEVEVALDASEGDELWPATEGRRVEKRRHEVALTGGLVAEVDRYEGALAGLCTVEVEFPTREDAGAFEPPEWFGEELTGRPEWSNAALAQHGRPR